MIANLILIPVLTVIWSTGRVTSADTPVTLSEDLYEVISQQLASNPPNLTTEEQGAKLKYEYYRGIRSIGE